MPTRQGPVLKRLRYYLSQMPPENVLPHKKLNASSRAALDPRGLRDGLAAAIEDIQQNLLYSSLRMVKRRSE